MGRDAADAQIGHELAGVVTLVGTQGFMMRTLERSGHLHRGIPFSLSCRLGYRTGQHQAAAGLHDAMAHEAQEGPNARGFLEQPGFFVDAGAVGMVGQQQAAKVAASLCEV